MRQAIIEPFTCPDCGRILQLAKAKYRKRCPECSAAHQKAVYLANLETYKENAKVKATLKQQEKKPTVRRKEADTVYQLQSKQCRKCQYRCKDGGLEFCDYFTFTGMLRDRGEGPGKCGSFLPKGNEDKANRIARARLALFMSETDWR